MQTKIRKILAYASLTVFLATVFLFSVNLTEAQISSKQTASPEAAAKALYAATRRENRAQALKVATPSVVKKLFAGGGGVDGLEFEGCERERGVWKCFYRGEGSGMNMIVSKKGSSYRVTAISFFAD